MSEALLKRVQEKLNEEKWTRATLSNYSINQFEELNAIFTEAREARCDDELRKLCDEHLGHTKNSISALFLGGMIAISQQIIDDASMVNLVTIFVDNHKDNQKSGVVKYLCERMLEWGESKFALRTLADCYRNDNEEEKVYSTLERLVKVDYEEADLAKSLAEYFEKLKDKQDAETKEYKEYKENAVDYYKKALHRYIAKAQFNNVREIWEKLLVLCPEDIDFFLHVEKRVAKNFDELKAGTLLKEVYTIYSERDINTAIAVSKLILAYDNDDRQARKDITECYRKKYEGHSQLEAYIRISSLAQGPRNVMEAIQDFEKHIAFDKGNFVFHRTWGVGRIASVQGDDITIDFARQRGHTMSLKMAVDALQTLAKDHIWVLKATWKKEKLHEKVWSKVKPGARSEFDPAWALKTIIKSFGNSCDLKRIKAELVPSVLTLSEWTTWSNKAREILKDDESFGISPESIDVFTVRERPIPKEEKCYNEFKAAKNFFDRAKVIREYAAIKNVELDTDYFTEMFAYFSGYLKSYNQVNEQVVTSFLLIKDLVAGHSHLGAGIRLNFKELFDGIGNVSELFLNLKDQKLKEEFLKHILLFVPGWADIYVKLFPRSPLKSIIDTLEEKGHEEKLTRLTVNCFENFRDNRESVIWLFRNASGKSWFEKAAVPFEKQLITLIHILDISYREIENRKDTVENRKINKQVYTILFTEDVINNYIDAGDTETITRIYTFINDVKDLDPADKMNLKNRITKKYPDFKFFGDEEKKVTTLSLMVTLAKYIEKQKELAHINDVEIPANAKEIDSARQHGDLSENAEYTAAKEKQTQLNSQRSRLIGEIDRAQLFEPSQINTTKVSFGTRVTLLDRTSGDKKEYTILGPWESDPDNMVISYLSPFGAAVLNKAVGEDIDFSLNPDEKVSYTVEAISPASF